MMSNDLWRTPPEVIAYIENRFGDIDIDLCSSDDNKVCEFNINEDDNFLDPKWMRTSMVDLGGHAWINCPYSNPTPFMQMAARWARYGYNVSGILNFDPSMKWFPVVLDASSVIMPIIGDHVNVPSKERDIGRIAFLDGNGEPQTSNNKPQFMFHMPAFGRTSQITDYVPIKDIYPNGRPLKRRRK